MPLGSNGGQLEVLRGRVWLTRAGDLELPAVRAEGRDRTAAEGLQLASAGALLERPFDPGWPLVVVPDAH